MKNGRSKQRPLANRGFFNSPFKSTVLRATNPRPQIRHQVPSGWTLMIKQSQLPAEP